MTHEFDGKKYEKASSHQKEWGSRLIAEFALLGNESILDLGCGDGTLTRQLADLVPEGLVLGIDASQGMIDAAKARVRDNLTFMKMDINELSFDNQFDLVFSNAALHWVKDHRSLLLNIQRALRDNGRVRLNFAAEGNCSNFFSVVQGAISHGEFSSHFAAFEWPWYMPRVDEYTMMAESSGLCDVHVWGENADRFFPDEEAMIRWIDQPSLVPFLGHIPHRMRDEFRDFVVLKMIERTRQENGTCFETFRRINLSAQKGQCLMAHSRLAK